MKNIQKLDTVLSLFDPDSDKRGMHLLQIQELLKGKNIDFKDILLREILHKLVNDSYLRIELDEAIVGPHRLKDVEFYLLTFDGIIFVKEGGYTTQKKKKRVVEFPKNYWWIIAVIAYLMGMFSDILKEALKQRILPASRQQERQFQPRDNKVDSVKIH